MAGQYNLNKGRRIRRNAEYKYVYRKGVSEAGPLMVMIAVHGRGGARAGFSAGKKYGNSVKRNRAKRLMRESYRLLAQDIKPGILTVFIARGRMRDAEFRQVYKAMVKLLKRQDCFK